jgi:hypothetical protein
MFLRAKFEFRLTSAVDNVELARLPRAADSPESFKLLPAERVQPLVPGRVLHEAGLVAEPVVAVLSHAVKVSLVLAVVAAAEPTVLVEPEPHVSLRHRLVLEHSHRVVHAGLLGRGGITKGVFLERAASAQSSLKGGVGHPGQRVHCRVKGWRGHRHWRTLENGDHAW